MLGLGCSAGFSLVAGSWGCSLAAVSGLLTELASPVAGRGLKGTLVVHGLSGGGSRALELRLSGGGSWALELRLSGGGSWALELRLSGGDSQVP